MLLVSGARTHWLVRSRPTCGGSPLSGTRRMLHRGALSLSASASASASTAATRQGVIPLLGRSAPRPNPWPTAAGNSSTHRATLVVVHAVTTTDLGQLPLPRLSGSTGLVRRRPERNAKGRHASAPRAAGADDVLDVNVFPRSIERARQKASGTSPFKSLTYLRQALLTDKALPWYLKLRTTTYRNWRTKAGPHRAG